MNRDLKKVNYMREIFRGKDKVTGKWVYGDLIHICDGMLMMMSGNTHSL